MKTKASDCAALISTCLALGGIGTAVIMCLLIGFGFHTVVGKEALYSALVLQAVNLAVMWRRERRLKTRDSACPGKRSLLLRVFGWVWCVAAVLLLLSLLLALCGMGFGSFWVKYPCAVGAALLPVGWLGLIVCVCRSRPVAPRE